MKKYNEGETLSQAVREQLVELVRPLLTQLDERPDKRLVRTFLRLLQVLLVLWHNRYGLLRSELGSYLLGWRMHRQAPVVRNFCCNLLAHSQMLHCRQ